MGLIKRFKIKLRTLTAAYIIYESGINLYDERQS